MTDSNTVRSMRAVFALRSYVWAKGEHLHDDDMSTAITDLLTDLLHLCDVHELRFVNLADTALMHYVAECEQGGDA